MFHRRVSEPDLATIPVTARSLPSGVTATAPEAVSGACTVADAAAFSGSATSHSWTSLSGARVLPRAVWSKVARVFPSGLYATQRLPPFSGGSAAGGTGSVTFHRSVRAGTEPVAGRRG